MSENVIKNEPAETEADAVSSDQVQLAEKPSADDPMSELSNEVYNCDRQYAIVLAQLMAIKDREKVYKWLERFDTMSSCDKREDRDLYLRFLILSLNNRVLVPPFTKAPPPGLRPLSNIMPRSVHNLIYKNKYVTGDCNPPENTDVKSTYSPPDVVEPKMFLSRQPIPRNGGVVYAAAFSTR